MIPPTLLDTGPWVAFADRRDPHHPWSIDRFREVRGAFLTCEPVLTETCFLLRKFPPAVRLVLDLVSSGVVAIGFHCGDEAAAVAALMDRYANIPMSLADACLVRMAEIHPNSRILTLDSDFHIYRKNGREILDVAIPEDRP